MARKHWNLVFANMVIPVAIVKIGDEADTNFKEMHTKCGHRLGRLTYCPTCTAENNKGLTSFLEKVQTYIDKAKKGVFLNTLYEIFTGIAKYCSGNVFVPKEEKSKGWADDKEGKLLAFTDAERKSLQTIDVPAETIRIVNFIDPLPTKFFKGNHYAVTPKAQNMTYITGLSLLLHGLEKTKKVALVKYFEGSRQYNATIDSNGVLSQIFYATEVSDEKEMLKSVKEAVVDPKLDTLIVSLIKKSTKDFNIANLKDTYYEAILKKVEEKRATGTFTVTEGEVVVESPTVDFAELLSASIDALDKVA